MCCLDVYVGSHILTAKNLRKTIGQLKAQYDELMNFGFALGERIIQIKMGKVDILDEELKKLRVEISIADNSALPQLNFIELQKQIQALSEQLQKLERTNVELADSYKRNDANLQGEIRSLESQCSELTAQIKLKEDNLSVQSSQIENFKSQIKKLQLSNANLTDEQENDFQLKQAKDQKIATLEKEQKTLLERLAAEQEAHQQTREKLLEIQKPKEDKNKSTFFCAGSRVCSI